MLTKNIEAVLDQVSDFQSTITMLQSVIAILEAGTVHSPVGRRSATNSFETICSASGVKAANKILRLCKQEVVNQVAEYNKKVKALIDERSLVSS